MVEERRLRAPRDRREDETRVVEERRPRAPRRTENQNQNQLIAGKSSRSSGIQGVSKIWALSEDCSGREKRFNLDMVV